MSDDHTFDEDAKSDNNNHSSEELTIENIMRNEENRKFIWGFLQSSGVFGSVFDADPLRTAYNSGKRDAGLLLESKLKDASPGFYLTMLKENIQ